MTGRTIEYVFPDRAGRGAASRRRAAGRGPRPARASSPTSTSSVRPARSSASPDWSAPGAPRSWRRSTAPAGPPRARSSSTGTRLRAGQRTAAVRGRAWAWRPRSARARRLLLAESVTRNVSLAALARFARGGCSTAAPNGAAARAGRRARRAPRPTRRGRPHPLRRQPAEGRARPAGCCAAAGCCCSTSRPAASTSAPAPRSTPLIRRLADDGRRRSARLQRGARGARPRRPGAGAPGGRVVHGRRPAELDEHRVLDLVMEEARHERRVDQKPAPGGSSVSATSRSGRRATAPGPPADRPRAALARFARARPGATSAWSRRLLAVLHRRRDHRRTTGSPASTTRTILTLASIIGVVSVGMTFVIIGGGIDLSVGAMVARAGLGDHVATQGRPRPQVLMVFTASRSAPAAAWSTACSSRTAGSSRSSPRSPCSPSARGLAEIIPTARRRSSPSARAVDLSGSDVLGIPPLVLVFAAVAVAGWLLLNRTTFGRRTIAVGGNAEAARLAGIDVRRQRSTSTCSPASAAASPPSC